MWELGTASPNLTPQGQRKWFPYITNIQVVLRLLLHLRPVSRLLSEEVIKRDTHMTAFLNNHNPSPSQLWSLGSLPDHYAEKLKELPVEFSSPHVEADCSGRQPEWSSDLRVLSCVSALPWRSSTPQCAWKETLPVSCRNRVWICQCFLYRLSSVYIHFFYHYGSTEREGITLR